MNAISYIVDFLSRNAGNMSKMGVKTAISLYVLDLFIINIDRLTTVIEGATVISQDISLSGFGEYVGFANAFIPISETFAFFSAYVSLAVSVVTVKWLVRFLPKF